MFAWDDDKKVEMIKGHFIFTGGTFKAERELTEDEYELEGSYIIVYKNPGLHFTLETDQGLKQYKFQE
jgi:hypothetical protein